MDMAFEGGFFKGLFRSRSPGNLTRSESRAMNDVFSDLVLPDTQQEKPAADDEVTPVSDHAPVTPEQERDVLAALNALSEETQSRERKKKKRWVKGALIGLAAGAVLSEGNHVDVEPKFRVEDQDDDRKPSSGISPVSSTETASISSIEPIEANDKGMNQMLLDMLKQLENKDQAHFDKLVHEGERPIVAAERIAKQSGAWDTAQNLSLAVHEGDRLVVEDGDLFYVTADGGETRMTEGGEVVRAWKSLGKP